jgi:hypothetical protein
MFQRSGKSLGPARNGFLLHLVHVDQQEICTYCKISGRDQMEQKYTDLSVHKMEKDTFKLKEFFVQFCYYNM